MNKLLVLSVLLAAQVSFAAPARETVREAKDLRARDAVSAQSNEMNQVRNNQVGAVHSEADARFAEKLANADTRASAAKDASALKGVLDASTSSEVTASNHDAINKFLADVRATSKEMNSGDVTAVLERTAQKDGLNVDEIREKCGGI